MSFSILGTGKAVPEYVLTNNELSTMVDTSDEWITTRTGIGERRIMTTETITGLCVDAALSALEEAGVSAKELDLIICATMRGDFITPSQACIIQKEIGATCPAFDMNGACSGFVYAMDVAQSYFISKKVKKVLIVGFDNLSSFTDWTDRSTCVLFGDGGGAIVLGEGDDLLAINLTAKGNNEVLFALKGENTSPFSKDESAPPKIYMNGNEVYKFAVTSMVRGVRKAIKDAGLTPDDIDHVIPHQANIRIIDAAASKLGIPKEKYVCNIQRYGNTAAGCIPIAIDEANKSKKLKKGDIIAICAFGGGLTTGSCIVRWSKD